MKRRQIIRLRVILLAGACIIASIPPAKSLVQCWQRLKRLNNDIERLEHENLCLQQQIETIRTDPNTVERIARMQGLLKDGEVRIRIRRKDAAH